MAPSAYKLFKCILYIDNNKKTTTKNMHACTHTHSLVVVSQCNGTEGKVFEKRRAFKKDLKEMTEAA